MSSFVSNEEILYAEDSEIVCYCSGVSKGMILEAIRNGAKTLQEIRFRTGACTLGRCGELSPRKR